MSWLRIYVFVFAILCNNISLSVLGQNWDIQTLKNIQNKELNDSRAVYYYSQSIYPLTVSVPSAGLVYGFFTKNEKIFNQSMDGIIALGTTYVLTNVTKNIFQRERPFEKYSSDIKPYYRPDGYSFFSGHTSIAFALATSISINYPKWYVYLPAYAYAVGIGYSRLLLGVHYPSDVIIGGLVGIGSSIASHYFMSWLRHQTYYPKMNRFKEKNQYSLALKPTPYFKN